MESCEEHRYKKLFGRTVWSWFGKRVTFQFSLKTGRCAGYGFGKRVIILDETEQKMFDPDGFVLRFGKRATIQSQS